MFDDSKVIGRRNAFGPNLNSGVTTASLSVANDAGPYYFTRSKKKRLLLSVL